MKKIEFSQKSAEGKQTRIGKKVGNVVVIMQMISVVFAVGMCVIMFRSLATGMLEQRCTNGTNMLDYVLGQTGGTEDVNQLLDDLKSRMGCEFTIFEGNTRAYTTVVQNGQRVVGTTCPPSCLKLCCKKDRAMWAGQPFWMRNICAPMFPPEMPPERSTASSLPGSLPRRPTIRFL